eukprot:TRINITY_DN39869_c0_g1_i1.p1 TRINITY_DN39869_c0_g1~~TRINITY_DN39869_c0_g1_i1.p1  ORF type:complete len:465 (+),score=79.93 TRINITY_DN39869_c0_g1_i1:117-1397(+)
MVRMAPGRGDTSNINKAAKPSPLFDCTSCGKRLPRSMFAKAELNRGGNGRCRECAHGVFCKGCNSWLVQAEVHGKSTCRKCQENAQVDRLLQTPKDEVTHFGVEHVLRLDRETEHEALLVCQMCGISERMVLQRILDFIRVPFVATRNGMHFCELCNETFPQLPVSQGQRVCMDPGGGKIDWTGCPGLRLAFIPGEVFTVAELVKTPNDRWFFRTLATPPKPPKPTAGTSAANTKQNTHFGNQISVSAGSSNACPDGAKSSGQLEKMSSHFAPPMRGKDLISGSYAALPTFASFWAPLDATLEGRRPSPLVQHLGSTSHKAFETVVASGCQMLVSRAALKLARELGESPTMSLSRFQAGLGITDRFCDSEQAANAAKLERVRDSHIPVKFLREVLPSRQDFVWITAAELCEAEEKYEQKRKRSSRK